MNAFSDTSLDADALLARIRAEAARRKSAGRVDEVAVRAALGESASAAATVLPLDQPTLAKPAFVSAARYHLNDFLALHDEDFLDAAYRGVLKRGGDAQGRAHYLASLRSGALSKIEVLGRLRYSPEGRRHRVPVKGLLPAFAAQHVCRIPVVGGVVAFATALVHLPRIARNLQGFEAYQHLRNAELETAIRHVAQGAEVNERRLGEAIDGNSVAVDTAIQRALAASEAAIAECRRADVERGDWGKWREQIDKLQSRARTHFTAISQRLSTVELRSEVLEKRVDDAEPRSDALAQRAQLAVISQRLTTVESSNDVLERRVDGAEFRGDALAQRIAHSEEGIEALGDQLSQIESHKQNIDRQLVDVIELAQRTSVQLATSLSETLGTLERRVEGLSATLDAVQGDFHGQRLRLAEYVAQVEDRIQGQDLRLSSLSAATAELAKHPVASSSASARFDQIYFAFEQRFRGTREDIRTRLTYYLPMIRDSVVGKAGATVVDVGCGRGEWLELLRDEGIRARGIDINETMAKECVERGLDVSLGEAIAQLRQLPDKSLGALTGFHIIEHMPLDSMIELIEEARRIVQPGGLVIFETPNPENIVVGACNFYIDPTHQRPLPPPLTRFLVEAAGFVDVAVHPVNAELLPQVFPEPDEKDPPALRGALNYLRSVFLAAPDYGVVGRVA